MGSSRDAGGVDHRQVCALAEVLDGHEMLEELTPWPGAAVLWDIFRAVKERAVASGDPPEARGIEEQVERSMRELVRGGAWVTREMLEALEVVIGVLTRPETGRWTDAGLACEQIAGWAGDRGLPVTRFCFSAMGALTSPDDYWVIRGIALTARDLAHWRASRTWFAHAAKVARRSGAWDEHVRAILGIGNTHYQQGSYSKARRALRHALRLARKHSSKELEGNVLHDLVVIAVDTHHTAAAERYARSALAAYGRGHENIPALAHDLALAWIRDGYAERAVAVFQTVIPHLESKPMDRLKALANMAHAAAASGDRALFRKACSDVSEAARYQTAASVRPGNVLQLAYGAASLAEWRLAEEFGHAAMQAAVERGEVDVIGKADLLLRSITSPVAAARAAAAHPRADGAAKKAASPADKSSDVLAEQLIRSMVAGDVLRRAQGVRSGVPAGDLLPHQDSPFEPMPVAQAHHTVFRRCAWSARIVEYASFSLAAGPNSPEWDKVLHLQSDGRPSFNRATRSDVPPPHVHDPSVPGGVRAARPDEIPRRPW